MTRDPAHWLWRLSAAKWLEAGRNELAQAVATARRAAVAHMRRGAGMGLNAVLVAAADAGRISDDEALTVWGRSYIEHLDAVASGRMQWLGDDAEADRAQALATRIRTVPVTSSLVQLGVAKDADVRPALEAALSLLQWCRAAASSFARPDE